MRKIALIFILLLSQTAFLYAQKDCTDLEDNYNALKDQVAKSVKDWSMMQDSDPNKSLQGKFLTDMLAKGVKIENDYNDCLSSVKKINDLINTYFNLGDGYFSRHEWDKAIEQYKKVTDLDSESYKASYNIGSVYLNKGALKDALEYYQHARYFAHGKAQVQESQISIDKIQKMIDEQGKFLTPPSDDIFSYLQYYLKTLNVPEAWKKISKPKQVVVAVIDDGVNINHPDLTDHIWTETGSAYGSSKIKDFVGDNLPDNLPTGEHGTMIAGIIAATADNKKGIAGIAKNVKIMPLRVFDSKGNATEDSIVNAMYYAIDHHANIINISLGQSQFAYSAKYDDVIKKAYESGIIVIIAAGNGDILAYSNNGVNTSVNPISPVCNNSGSQKYSFGVESLDQKGARAPWSNYGDCVSFSAPGENIFSTSVSVFNKETGVDYDTGSGTSFSAPMIAGIIALGYNKFGYVSPNTVYASLNESLKMNDADNYVVDAGRYLDVLEKKSDTIKKEQSDFAKNGKNSVNNSKKTSPLPTLITKDFLASTSRLSDGDFLSRAGLIDSKIYPSGSHLGDLVTREEVVMLALKMLNMYLPDSYSCRGMYTDVSSKKPDKWACSVAEIGTDKNLVKQVGKNFKPREKLTLAETLGILMKAGNIRINQYSGGEFDPEQTNIIGTAFQTGIIDGSFNIYPKKQTLRSDLFRIARKIILLRK